MPKDIDNRQRLMIRQHKRLQDRVTRYIFSCYKLLKKRLAGLSIGKSSNKLANNTFKENVTLLANIPTKVNPFLAEIYVKGYSEK